MTKNGREDAIFSEPVEWTSPTGQKLIGNVIINAEIYIGTIWGKLIQRNLLNFKESLGFSKTVFIQTTYFEDNLVKYSFENQGEQICQTIKHFNKEDRAKFLVTTRLLLSAEKFHTKTKMKILH